MDVRQSFRRVTTSGGYVAEIDGLRFVAISAVVAVHIAGYWTVRAGKTYASATALDHGFESIVGLGFFGVHLFFMISGFVLAMPFCRNAFSGGSPVNLERYFWRRLTRLEPPYIITMLGFFALMPFFREETWRDLLPHLIASLAYVHNIVYGQGSLINNNAWSLEIEVQFYILMPLFASLLFLPAALRRITFCSAAILLSLNRLWLPAAAPQSFLQFGQYFLIGILLCDAWTNSWAHLRRSVVGDIPGLIAWPLFVWVNLRQPGLPADLANPWLIALLFVSALRGKCHATALAFGPIPIIGGMCYSIYLLHARVLAIAIHGILAKLPSLGGFFVDYLVIFPPAFAAVLVVSAFFFLIIERPCMNPDWPRVAIAWLKKRLPAYLSG